MSAAGGRRRPGRGPLCRSALLLGCLALAAARRAYWGLDRPLVDRRAAFWVRGGSVTRRPAPSSPTNSSVGTASGNKGPPQVDVASGDFFTVGERFSELAAEESAARAEEEDEDGGGLGQEQGAAAGTALRARDSRALYKSLRYGVVAILGSQSSGKSTLLNALFGTRFPVLDPAATGIKRTTQGVWVDLDEALPKHTLPMVVLDMEGLESTAREEVSGVFDEQLATLAAAVANVVMVNVWARDVRMGGGVGLKQLFRGLAEARGGKGRRRAVVVVMRDSEDPAADVRLARELVRRELEEAYMNVGRRGEAAREAQLCVMALPHAVYQRQDFEAAVAALRRRFDPTVEPGEGGDEDAQLEVLLDLHEGRRLQPVPLARFPPFAVDFWSSVSGGRAPEVDAGLREMAQRKGALGRDQIDAFLRAKIVESCCVEAERAIERLEAKVECAVDMPILEFGRDAEGVFDAALGSLRDRVKQYRGGSGEEERQVVAALCRRMGRAYAQHLDALYDFYVGRFQDGFGALYVPLDRFDKEARALCKDVCATFERAARAAVPPHARDSWSYQAALAKLKDEIEVEVADRRTEIEVAFPPEQRRVRFLRAGWWKQVLLKALIVYINYLQTVQATQAAVRAARRRQDKYPPFPLF